MCMCICILEDRGQSENLITVALCSFLFLPQQFPRVFPFHELMNYFIQELLEMS